MAKNDEIRTPEEMASQQINATNPGQMAVTRASQGGMADTSEAAEEIEEQDNDFMQLMYEQSSELDQVSRIVKDRKQSK